MSRCNAVSDRDYDDEAHGPYPRRVERTCAQCRKPFLMVVEGEYVMNPLCDRCLNMQDAMRRVRQIEAETFVKK